MPSKNPERNRELQREFRARMSPEQKKKHDRERYIRNKEKYNEQSKKWAEENPHKARASAHQSHIKQKYPEAFTCTDIVTRDLAEWLEDSRGTPCPYCADPARDIEHITPLSKGGEHKWENIEIVCAPCNRAKGDMDKEEFLQWLHRLASNIIKGDR